MQIRLLFFAGLREAVGKKELLLELPDHARLKDALSAAEQDYPIVAQYAGRLHISLNQERQPWETCLKDGDEIALLPPMSGGDGPVSGAAVVQPAPLSMDALLKRVMGPRIGGVATFTGVVRNHARGHTIDHLEYEAYVPMAEKEMEKIVAQVRERWPDVELAMSHRVGRLEIGEAAVMIAAGSPHRAEAFEACRFAIDTLKQTVPIWKKEFADEGTYWVEENP